MPSGADRSVACPHTGPLAQRVLQPGVKPTGMNPQEAAHRPHRNLHAMQGDERVLPFTSLAKYAAAFLRNTFARGEGLELIAKRASAAVEICDNPGPMSLVVGHRTWISISHPKPKGIVKEYCNLECGRGDRFLLSDTPCQPPVECAKCSVASAERGCGQPQQCGRPAG